MLRPESQWSYDFHVDSSILTGIVNGEMVAKNPTVSEAMLRPIVDRLQLMLELSILPAQPEGKWITWFPRECNQVADAVANVGLLLEPGNFSSVWWTKPLQEMARRASLGLEITLVTHSDGSRKGAKSAGGFAISMLTTNPQEHLMTKLEAVEIVKEQWG